MAFGWRAAQAWIPAFNQYQRDIMIRVLPHQFPVMANKQQFHQKGFIELSDMPAFRYLFHEFHELLDHAVKHSIE